MEDLAGLAVPGGGPRPGFRRQISRPCRRTTRRPAVAQPAFSMDSAWRMTASTMGAHSCPCVLQHHGCSRFSSASRSKRERSAVSTRELVKARTADGGGAVWCSHDGSPFKRTGGGPELISEAQLQQPRAKVGCRAPEQVESVGLDTGSRYCLRARHRRRHPHLRPATHTSTTVSGTTWRPSSEARKADPRPDPTAARPTQPLGVPQPCPARNLRSRPPAVSSVRCRAAGRIGDMDRNGLRDAAVMGSTTKERVGQALALACAGSAAAACGGGRESDLGGTGVRPGGKTCS